MTSSAAAAQDALGGSRSLGMGLVDPQLLVPRSTLAGSAVPRPRAADEAALPRRERVDGAHSGWPAADRFTDRSGLASTQARVLLAVFCGLAPDHVVEAPPA